MLNQIIQAVNNLGLNVDRTVLFNLLETALVLLAFFVINGLVGRVLDRRVEDVEVRFRWKRGTSYVLFGLAALGTLLIWLQGLGSFATVLGLVSAGLAVALNQPLANIAGWVYMIWRRPFTVGDRIEIEGIKGDVIDQRLFTFVLLEVGNWVDAEQSTGRIVYIPNQKVFNQPIFNYSGGFQYIWHEVKVFITYESDWRKAKDIISEIASRLDDGFVPRAETQLEHATREFPIQFSTLEAIVYTRVVDRGVQLTARFICDPRLRRAAEETFWEMVLEQFNQHEDIRLAYPTSRIYNPEAAKAAQRAAEQDEEEQPDDDRRE